MKTIKIKNLLTQTLILFAAATTLNLAGCKKPGMPDKLPDANTKPRSAGDGRNDLLGHGYDVTGEYANSASAKFQVIDVDRLQNDQPTRVEWDLSKRQTGALVAGENVKSFLEKKSLNVKGGGNNALWKASITTTFTSNDNFYSKWVYSSFDLLIQQKRVKMNAGQALMRAYLTQSFLTDLANEAPAYLVQRYGTHVMTDITLGAKLQVIYRSETSNADKTRASEAGVDVSMGKVFSINTGYNHSEQEIQNNFTQSIHYQTIGGDPTQRIFGQMPIGTTVPQINISGWQSSSTEANAVLIDFNTAGLIPLYDLVADPTKQAALKAYIDQYLIDNGAKMEEGPQKIYAKVSYENENWHANEDYTFVTTSYDYYIRFYKSDRVTPITVTNLPISYRINTYSPTDPGLNRTGATVYRRANGTNYYHGSEIYNLQERFDDGWTRVTFWEMELLPGPDYEILR